MCMQGCPRGWKSKLGGTACEKPTKKQGKKEKNCSKYKAARGRKVSLNWLGECWQTCKSNEKLFLGMCFEKAKLTISIQDIFDALKKIFDHIKDLPIGAFGPTARYLFYVIRFLTIECSLFVLSRQRNYARH